MIQQFHSWVLRKGKKKNTNFKRLHHHFNRQDMEVTQKFIN